VIALFDNLSLVQYDDIVSVADRAQSVSDYYLSYNVHFDLQIVNRTLN